MKSLAKTSFKKEIEKVLTFYALMPVILSSMVFLFILALFLHRDISRESIGACDAVVGDIHDLITNYSKGAKDFSDLIDVGRFCSEPGYAAEILQEIYRFLGAQMVRGEFYLLSKDGALLYSTAGKSASAMNLRWNIVRRMGTDRVSPALYMYRYTYGGESMSELQIGAPSIQEGQWYGYVIFSIPADSLNEELVNPRRTPVIVTNRFHRILLGESFGFNNGMGKLDFDVREASGYTNLDSGLYYISSRPVPQSPFLVYAVHESGNMLRTILLISFLVAVIVISIIFAIYHSARVVSVKKTRIVDEIVQAFHNAENGDLDSQLHISSNDEFAAIGNSYNTMADSLRQMIERNKKQAQETALSRIKQLESQFNPHFLFNSLESVRFMIRMDPQSADEMIICLSRLLRYSIKNDSELVTLDEEMAYTQDYLQILSYRFGERFCCNICIPEVLENTIVPPLIFQPVIENVVKHGLDDREKIHVWIKTRVNNDLLTVEISDDGIGMTSARLMQVREMLARRGNKDNHIGIYNVHQRIRLMYGEQYGIHIESVQGKGTTVLLRLPVNFKAAGGALSLC